MSVSIRLSRGGSKKRPYYKVVVSNSRAPRDGKYLEQLGTYNPLLAKDDVNRVRLIEDRIKYWLGVGARQESQGSRRGKGRQAA
jgi:small subunit ribosomal protein S16